MRTIAYQLPSDCADIAIILRHVWLAAHHRTESYSNWTIGDAGGASAHRRMRTVIGSVFSGNVSRMVQPYADDSGATLKDFDLIAPILHEGDVLVWEHRETISKRGKPSSSKRTGGHTQTINRILRTGGNITGIQTLQGNQPIFSDAAEQILLSQRRRNTSPDSSEGERLRALPSRRLESDEAISISNINHPVTQTKIWGAIDNPSNDKNEIEFTILVAVGPPKTATRPASRTARSILNWNRIISSARLNNITGLLEAILLEARSMAESGGTTGNATANDMTTLGTSFGSRLKYLNRRDASQFANSKINFINIIDAIRSEANNSTAVAPLFDAFKIAFEDATK
ncbi:MAG: hypothetical protein IPP71_10330 [Bacteroidetes bacterium]|nr:hypothetical protein [Bacteroidota bacterium]